MTVDEVQVYCKNANNNSFICIQIDALYVLGSCMFIKSLLPRSEMSLNSPILSQMTIGYKWSHFVQVHTSLSSYLVVVIVILLILVYHVNLALAKINVWSSVEGRDIALWMQLRKSCWQKRSELFLSDGMTHRRVKERLKVIICELVFQIDTKSMFFSHNFNALYRKRP